MASTASATVSQNNLSGSQLLWSDTGSYGTIVSRTLTIYECNGNVLQSINLGTLTTYQYNITADGFYQFVCVIYDNTGGPFTSIVDYVAIGFYTAAYLNAFNGAAPRPINNCNLDTAENFLNASLRFNVAANFVAAQANIVAANIYVNLEQ